MCNSGEDYRLSEPQGNMRSGQDVWRKSDVRWVSSVDPWFWTMSGILLLLRRRVFSLA